MLLLVLQNKTITKLNSRVERLEKEKWNPYRQIWDLRMQLYHMEQTIESNFTERLGFLENSTTGNFTLRWPLTISLSSTFHKPRTWPFEFFLNGTRIQ